MPKGYKFYTASEKLAIVKRYIAKAFLVGS